MRRREWRTHSSIFDRIARVGKPSRRAKAKGD
jgi:hypothetical protein